MTESPVVVGAVAYTANVVPIWEGIKEYFADSAALCCFCFHFWRRIGLLAHCLYPFFVSLPQLSVRIRR